MTAHEPRAALPPQRVGEWLVFTLDDGEGTRLQVSDLGATWLSCQVPLGDGALREVLLGCGTPAQHAQQPGYLGAVVGRYANRIAGARFALDGRVVQLAPNEDANQLHGGPDGFDKRRWTVEHHDRRSLRLGLQSADGDQGFPGALQAWVTYTLEAPGSIALQFEATVDAPCPVNLTSHAYFNLDGPQAGAHRPIAEHRITLRASHYLPVNKQLIPLGGPAPVAGTPFDLRVPRAIGTQRFDHCFVLDGGDAPAATVWSGDGHLRMQLHTDYPGLQFYGGHFLAQTRGAQGHPYAAGAGFALEPQYWPDSPNHPEWPDHGVILRPGERLQRQLRLRFESPPQA
jgi:aldose 1-epimerase